MTTAPIEAVHEKGFDMALWLTHGMICSDLPREEVERRLRKHPSGTKNGWVIDKVYKCPDHKGNKHYLLGC